MKAPLLTFLVLSLFLVSGCFSLGREEPSQQHYVLGGSPPQAAISPAMRLAGVSIGLRQPQLAGYLETTLIVVRDGAHQIQFSENNRWGEQLSGGINRAVAGYLSAGAPFHGIDTVPWPRQARHDYLIQLHLLRFEGLLQEGAAILLANWEIIRQQDGEVLARGTTDYRANGWVAGDYAGLVTLLDSGLQELTDDLIARLETLHTP